MACLKLHLAETCIADVYITTGLDVIRIAIEYNNSYNVRPGELLFRFKGKPLLRGYLIPSEITEVLLSLMNHRPDLYHLFQSYIESIK